MEIVSKNGYSYCSDLTSCKYGAIVEWPEDSLVIKGSKFIYNGVIVQEIFDYSSILFNCLRKLIWVREDIKIDKIDGKENKMFLRYYDTYDKEIEVRNSIIEDFNEYWNLTDIPYIVEQK